MKKVLTHSCHCEVESTEAISCFSLTTNNQQLKTFLTAAQSLRRAKEHLCAQVVQKGVKMLKRTVYLIALAIAIFPIGSTAQPCIDATFDVDATNPNWQSTGIQIQSGDRLYLFGFGACYQAQGGKISTIGVAGTAGDTFTNSGCLPATGLGRGLVAKIGNSYPFGFGQGWCVYNFGTGELFLGFNDNGHYDNSGTLIVGILRIPDSLFHLTFIKEGNGTSISSKLHLTATPNPTTKGADICYTILKNGHVTLRILDNIGRVVTTLLDERISAGKYSLSWNGLTREGNPVPAGTYFYLLKANDEVITKEAVVLK
jgi:hypothetical protein